MRSIILLIFSVVIFSSCRDANDPRFNLSFDEILTKQSWQLDRYTTPTGRAILNNELTNPTAVVIKSMYFIFEDNKIVTAYDKASNQQIPGGRGAWSTNEDNSRISFELVGNTLDFRVIRMEDERMIWQAETGSFLTGVGQSINLEFTSRL